MNPTDIQKARALLAFAGADLSNIDKSFSGDAYYGDRSGYRQTVNGSIEAADQSIMRRITPTYIQQPAPQYETPIIQQPQMNYQPVISQPKISREERINKLLGKTTPQPTQPVVVQTDDYTQTVNAVKEALEPVTEQLEDIAVLIGLMVQRLEQLIKVVDADAIPEEVIQESQPFQIDEELEPEAMEVYDPEVSMSILNDEEDAVQETPKKKRKKSQ
jgi:hypothetical protein